MRDSYIFYLSFYEAIRELEPADRLTVYDAINEYSLFGEMPSLAGLPKAMMSLIKPQIDANQRRYQNGQRGGRPKTETEPKRNLNVTETEPKHNLNVTKTEPKHNLNVTKTEPNVNVNDNVNDNKNENVNKNENKSLSNPKLGALGAPAVAVDREREFLLFFEIFFFKGYADPWLEAEKFYDHYQGVGWVASNGNKIKNRLSVAKNWEQKDGKGVVEHPAMPKCFLDVWRPVYERLKLVDPDNAHLALRLLGVEAKESTVKIVVGEATNEYLTAHSTEVLETWKKHTSKALNVRIRKLQ